MMIDTRRYTSGRIAVANLSTMIESLELGRVERPSFENHLALSTLLFVRGDLLGRIADHNRAELVATDAIALAPDTGSALYVRAQLAERFHRFWEANARLDRALAAGYPRQKIDVERAALLQATGQYREARVLREGLTKDEPGIHTLGALERRCSRKWMNGRRPKPAMRPRSMRTMAYHPSRAANCYSNGV
jgi:tetratricopeptide (TPR) repeat protein